MIMLSTSSSVMPLLGIILYKLRKQLFCRFLKDFLEISFLSHKAARELCYVSFFQALFRGGELENKIDKWNKMCQ